MYNHAHEHGHLPKSDTRPQARRHIFQTSTPTNSPHGFFPPFLEGGRTDTRSSYYVLTSAKLFCPLFPQSVTTPGFKDLVNLSFPTVKQLLPSASPPTRDAVSQGAKEGGGGEEGNGQLSKAVPAEAWIPAASGEPWIPEAGEGWNRAGKGREESRGAAGVATLTLRSQWPRAAAESP